ncbi:hypothetical protein LTR53_008632, partial [Teratosphaeriaceae sp. CCFEE 6253]
MPSDPSRSPEPSAIQRTASNALQARSVKVERLDGYLYRTYRLTTSKQFFYLLRCRPSHHVRLLRHEEDRLEAEAGALQVLGARLPGFSTRLIEYATTSIAIGSKYVVSGPFGGSILADIESSFSRQAVADTDRSLGQFIRGLASVTGAAFGSLRQIQGTGSPSWGRVFAAMLETVLRDAEDALISLPYGSINDLVRRHRAALDQITQPRLVVLECLADEDVVVDTKTNRVTLLDWSTALWGDPYMSDVWYKPTSSFVEGYGKLPNSNPDERTRQYLYVLYHSLLAVVRHTYRPSDDTDDLEPRRDLTT